MVAIYALVDPRSTEIRYVGKTINLRQRIRDHCRDSAQNHKNNWLTGLRAVGIKPTMLVLERVPEHQWQTAERFWIAYLRFVGANLTNHEGGGLCGKQIALTTRKQLQAYRHTPERREKMRIAATGRRLTAASIAKRTLKQTGIRRSAETRAKMSAAASGRTFSKETRGKMRAAKLGTHRPDDVKRRISVALTGRVKPPEVLVKIGLANRGKKLSVLAIAKRTATRLANREKKHADAN